MLIELAYKAGCPCGEDAEANLAEALRKLDIDPGVVHRTLLESDEHAQRLRIPGCPTIRVNGIHADFTRRHARNYGADCRPTPQKKRESTRAPTVGDVIVAIKKTTCTRVGCC